jgi:hypothetical protein
MGPCGALAKHMVHKVALYACILWCTIQYMAGHQRYTIVYKVATPGCHDVRGRITMENKTKLQMYTLLVYHRLQGKLY